MEASLRIFIATYGWDNEEKDMTRTHKECSKDARRGGEGKQQQRLGQREQEGQQQWWRQWGGEEMDSNINNDDDNAEGENGDNMDNGKYHKHIIRSRFRELPGHEIKSKTIRNDHTSRRDHQ